jgi:LysR family transcriptional regulator, cys regulon transcriptional activator
LNLQQLRLLASVAQHDLNIGAAAAALGTTHSTLGKQLRQLEDELGFSIFLREGRTLTRTTPVGEKVIASARRILREVRNISTLGEDFGGCTHGTLSIGATHTEARHALPEVVREFRARYPNVQVHLHQGSVEQIVKMSELGQVEFTIATDSQQLFANRIQLPCFHWSMRIVVLRSHPLAAADSLTLSQLTEFPLITDEGGLNGAASLQQAFARAGLRPDVALTAGGGGVIKACVRLGLGVGILPSVDVDPASDADLVALDGTNLFPLRTTWIGIGRGNLVRGFEHEFIQLFAPHLTRQLVDQAASLAGQCDVEALFSHLEPRLPLR